jgi:hypothetical protein
MTYDDLTGTAMTVAPPSAPSCVPCLDAPSRVQRAIWGLTIACAVALLCAVAWRIGGTVLAQWWVPLSFVAGVTVSDFSSGLLHWAADTWGRADLPVIGPRLLLPFRLHHANPDDFLRRSFLDTNGDVAAVSLAPLIALLWLPLDGSFGQALAVAGFGFCAMGGLTNQIHQWAHMPAPPPAIAVLHRVGLMLGPRAHARHHGRPFDGHYCITTGWCNRPLEAMGFFRWLEGTVTRVTGAVPRHDEQHAPDHWQARAPDGGRHG